MSKKSKAVQQSTKPYKEYLNYLNSVDTSNVDTTLGNLTNWASNASSNNLGNMGDYTFSVDGSDDARQRAENALYASMLDKMTPQFERQQADYATQLQNKGLPVGSEAYERAMGDLQEKQNDALTQAAYASVMGGQDAYSQSLNDQIMAGNFGNAAQQAYINQLLSALNSSPSEYENKENIYAAGTAKSAVDYQNAVAKAKAKAANRSGLGSTIGTIGGAAIGGYFGGPAGAQAGAAIGGSVGSSLF